MHCLVVISMSSNLPADAKLAYAAYLDANSLDERILKLEIFLSKVPKHKATEKIVALNKSRLSKLKSERDTELKRLKTLTAAMEDPFTIKREPHCLQIMFVSDFFDHSGVGKTTLLKCLTGLTEARPGIFTATPLIGIYDWEHIKFQLVDEPALQEGHNLSRILGGIKTTDIICIMVDLTRNPINQLQNVLEYLDSASIYLNRQPPNMKITKTGSGGIQLFFLSKAAKKSEHLSEFLKEIAKESGSGNMTVKIYEEITVEDCGMAFNRASRYIPAILIATKADLPNSKLNFTKLHDFLVRTHPTFTTLPIAITTAEDGSDRCQGFENFGKIILEKLDMIRVFTKSRKGVADRPLVLKRESTIKDVALKIHKELYKTFKFAMVYRATEDPESGDREFTEHVPMRIKAGLNFKIEENDIIEIHSRIR